MPDGACRARAAPASEAVSAVPRLRQRRGSPGAQDEEFDIWTLYPEKVDLPVELLDEDERADLLGHPVHFVRAAAAAAFFNRELAPEQRKIIEAIRDSGDDLLSILTNILDFSKLQAGRMTFDEMPFSPATLTQHAISLMGPRAGAKGLAISAETDPLLPSALRGDAGRMGQVLLNLL